MLTNSQKEHLTYTAIGQVVTIIALSVWWYSYILPWLDKISVATAGANTSIEKFQKTESDWLGFDQITEIIKPPRTEYAELLKIMYSDSEGTRTAIAKGDKALKYMEWLKIAISDSSKDKEILSQQKQILNSIIPTLSPISGNIEEDNIDLKWYIKFVEWKILKQFNFESNIALWLDSIVWWKNSDGIPENIGSIELQISFKWTNNDIIKFVDYINNSGNPKLLTEAGTDEKGKLSLNKIPAVMSNPLIVITSFSLENAITWINGDEENSGRATIKLYVRWISKDDVSYLRENIKVREEDLSKKLTNSISECKSKLSLCGDTWKRLDKFSRKLQEYKLWTSSMEAAPSTGANGISALAQKAKVLKSLENELVEITSEK